MVKKRKIPLKAMRGEIELVEEAAPADEHGNGTEKPVAVKWFNHQKGQWRRFHCQPWTYAALMAQLRAIEPNFRGQLFYRDFDGDAIVFSTDTELRTMLQHHREQLKTDTVKLESKADECFDLDMSSLGGHSSSISSSDGDDSTAGWMLVKKESFKKLCDFTNVANNNTKGYIMVLDEEKGVLKPVEMVVANLKRTDEVIGHSGKLAPQQPLVEKPKQFCPEFVPEKQKKGEQCTDAIMDYQNQILENMFYCTMYITKVARKDLAKQTQLSEEQVEAWFSNRRAKTDKMIGRSEKVASQQPIAEKTTRFKPDDLLPEKQKREKQCTDGIKDFQNQILENVFKEVKFMSVQDRQQLAKWMGLSDQQVKTWFENRRAEWKKCISKAQDQAE